MSEVYFRSTKSMEAMNEWSNDNRQMDHNHALHEDSIGIATRRQEALEFVMEKNLQLTKQIQDVFADNLPLHAENECFKKSAK